jgi:hypothetical protein
MRLVSCAFGTNVQKLQQQSWLLAFNTGKKGEKIGTIVRDSACCKLITRAIAGAELKFSQVFFVSRKTDLHNRNCN